MWLGLKSSKIEVSLIQKWCVPCDRSFDSEKKTKQYHEFSWKLIFWRLLRVWLQSRGYNFGKVPYKTIEKLNKHHIYVSYQDHGEKQTDSWTTTPIYLANEYR